MKYIFTTATDTLMLVIACHLLREFCEGLKTADIQLVTFGGVLLHALPTAGASQNH